MNYCGDLKSDHSKSELFEDQISNGPVFKGSGYGPASRLQIPFYNIDYKKISLIDHQSFYLGKHDWVKELLDPI